MKKTLSVLLAVLMLLAALTAGFAVFADGETTCSFCGKAHTSTEAGKCSCCLNCPYLDMSKVSACAKDANGVKKDGGFCCANCTGFYDCTCGKTCKCEFCQGTGDAADSDLKPLIPEQTQDYIKSLFQNIIHKISEVFDRMFEVAFAIFNIK